MTKTEYAEILKGERWQQLRKDVLHDQPYCDECGMPRWLAAIAYDQDLHVHHKSYVNRGTDNEYGDLIPLCRRCHDVETFGRSDLKAPKTATCTICDARHWNPYSDLCETCGALSVNSDKAFTSLNKKDPYHWWAPLWVVTMTWGIRSNAAASVQLDALETANVMLRGLKRQIEFERDHPGEICGEDNSELWRDTPCAMREVIS